MLSVHLVLEIYGLKVVVSFNFAPSAPHVKRRVKSCEPRAAAATYGSKCVKIMEGSNGCEEQQQDISFFRYLQL